MEWTVRPSTSRTVMLCRRLVQVEVWLEVGGSLKGVCIPTTVTMWRRDQEVVVTLSGVWCRHGGVNNESFGIRPPVQAST
jgi:hypothetical protein